MASLASSFDPQPHTANFDDLYFRRDAVPNTVPALSWTGLFVLAVGLCAAALWALRRSRPTPRPSA